MKKSLKLFAGMVLLIGLWMTAGSVISKAADVPIAPSADMNTAPEIAIGTSYYATMNNTTGYVSFVVPPQVGYIQVYYKNISIDTWAYMYVKTVTGEVLAKSDKYPGNHTTWEFTCDNGNDMEPGQRYYIQVGDSAKSGNVLFSVSFQADANPDSKEQAEEIQLNTEYTRSIDSDIVEDEDYFKFTTGKNGGHRLSINRSSTSGTFYWQVRKWATDELAKTSEIGRAHV